ncbi:MAG: HIT family protein [Pseudomonadota bacterium]
MSLTKSYDPDNIFAKIISGEFSSVKIFEDDHVLAFMDVFPQSEGHMLVISKTATAVNLLDMPEDALQKVILASQLAARAAVAALSPDGVRVVQFNGSAAGQSVFHLHFHVIPMWEGRALSPHGGNPVEADELEKTAQKIREQL